MEYGINQQDQIYYPANQINSSKKEISRKTTKMAPTRIPLGGMGNGIERAHSKDYFITEVKILKH